MIHVCWIDRGSEATQPPNPDYPDGVSKLPVPGSK